MASSLSPIATWDTLEDVFYRKDEVYQMSWRVPDSSDFVVAVGKNGGPIASSRDERKVSLAGRHTPGKPKIQVYTSSGEPIAMSNWDLPTPISMHFTSTHLVVVSDEGTYRSYDSSSGDYTQHTSGTDVADLGIVSAKAWEDGIVASTGNSQFVESRGWKGARITNFADSGSTEPPHTWEIVPPDHSHSGHVEVLFATGETAVTLDSSERTDQQLSRGPFSHISLSPNGRFYALVMATGALWVVSSDFSRNLSEVDVTGYAPEGATLPDRAEWCGDNAVVSNWGPKVVMVGPGGDALEYTYPPSAVIVGEVDALRIISSSTCEILQKVPDASSAVFQPGSDHPAAVSYDASDYFERKSPKADEAIRSIRPDSARAVDVCTDAAGREWDTTFQQRLLRAAQFGRAFSDSYNPNDFVTMAQTSKVSNAVRFYEIGIPITYDEYIFIGPPASISRSLTRNMHLLALRISQYLGLRPDPVSKHWAVARIARSKSASSQESDAGLCSAIVEKFEKEGERASYADIAKKAWEAGRVRLATMSLDHESRAAEQVPLLLEMKQDKIASEKAVDSGDTDLVYHVSSRLQSASSPGDFFHSLDDSSTPALTPAVRSSQVYARENNRQLSRDFYYQDDRRVDAGTSYVEEAYATPLADDRAELLRSASKSFAEDKDAAFESKQAEDAARLLQMQAGYEAEADHRVALRGLSLSDTISALITHGSGKRAEALRSAFKVPDKRWWWLKLKALAAAKNWTALETFAKSKKSPIGYEPFVRHLLAVEQPGQAASYVPRCEARHRPDLYVECGLWGKAAEAAKERGDKSKLEEIRQRAPSGSAQREVEEVIRRAK